MKITKRECAFKDLASSYNVEFFFFNPELQRKGTESAIKNELKKIIVCIKRI